MPPIPDLVKVSKLDTQFSSNPEYTQHIQYFSANALERRKLSKEERWKKEGILGRGSYGVVRLERCIHGDNIGKLRAVKKVQKIDGSNYHRELEAIALFSHHKYEECFVKSYGWYDNEDSIFITMEYLPNGDLHKYLDSPLLENEGQYIVSQVLEGLDFMHQFGFAHRDLKPANILVVSKRPNWWVKIADFGISKRASEELTALRTLTGTPAFAAPEVLGFIQSDSYTNAVDIWSLGVITFLLLTGETLFKDQRRLAQYVVGSFEFPLDSLLARNISEQGCKFVRSLMAPDPKDRPGAKESRGNPWLDNLQTLTILEPLGNMKISESQEALSSYSAAEASARWSALDTDKQTVKADSRAFAKPPTTTSKPENLLNPTLTVRNSVNVGILTVLKGHSEALTAVAFSPDSKLIASGSWDSTLKIWDSATEASRAILAVHSQRITDIAFSPDGKLIASASADKTLRLWDLATGASRTLEGHSDKITAIAFSPDGKLIASASADATVRLWDSATGASRAKLEGHSYQINAIAFSPDGKLIASASADKTVRLWDSATGANLTTLKGHSSYIPAIAFSPDGKLIASASADKTVRLWDSATGASRATLKGHSDLISAIAFSPDGKLIASASYDSTVRLWDSATGASLATLKGHSNRITAIAFSPDGKRIASGCWDYTIRVWGAILPGAQKNG